MPAAPAAAAPAARPSSSTQKHARTWANENRSTRKQSSPSSRMPPESSSTAESAVPAEKASAPCGSSRNTRNEKQAHAPETSASHTAITNPAASVPAAAPTAQPHTSMQPNEASGNSQASLPGRRKRSCAARHKNSSVSAPAYFSAASGGWNSSAPAAPPSAAGARYWGSAPAAKASANGEISPSSRTAERQKPTSAVPAVTKICRSSAARFAAGRLFLSSSKAKIASFLTVRRHFSTEERKKPSSCAGRENAQGGGTKKRKKISLVFCRLACFAYCKIKNNFL